MIRLSVWFEFSYPYSPYTAHLGRLAGPMCRSETQELIKEAVSTALPGVLGVEGFLSDLKQLDAASSLNATKMFKICPAPDVSPGSAMMERMKQVGDGNIADPLGDGRVRH